MELLWGFVIIGGPIILGLAIAFGTFQHRKRNRRMDAASEEGARRVREDIRREEDRVESR